MKVLKKTSLSLLLTGLLLLFFGEAGLGAGSPFFNGSGGTTPTETKSDQERERAELETSSSIEQEKKTDGVTGTLLPKPGDLSKKTGAAKRSGLLGSAFSMIGSLILVLGIFLVVIYFLKKLNPQEKGILPREFISCLGQYPLSPKIRLYLLSVGSKLILLASTGDGVETVTEITDPEEVARFFPQVRRADGLDRSPLERGVQVRKQ